MVIKKKADNSKKGPNPNPRAMERANDNARFKRTVTPPSPSSDTAKPPLPVKDTSKPPVTGKLSIAAVRMDLRENTGNTPRQRAAFGGRARVAKAKAAGWKPSKGDRREALYNPKRRPR